MMTFIETIGKYFILFIQTLGSLFLFTYTALSSKNTLKYRLHRIIIAIYSVGTSSVLFITSIALFTGLIVAVQGYSTLIRFGAQSLLGNAVSITLVQELAPVLTAIMLIARAGSATTSHLAVMRITEQIQALHVHNISPLLFLIRPTLLAFLLSTPILTLFFITIALTSAYYFAVFVLYIPSGVYIQGVIQSTSFSDIIYSIIKACVFALIIGSITCYIGYNIHTLSKEKGATAIRIATTTSVVISCIAILITNYILTSIFFT